MHALNDAIGSRMSVEIKLGADMAEEVNIRLKTALALDELFDLGSEGEPALRFAALAWKKE